MRSSLARGIAIDRRGTLDGFADRLEADPAAGIARQREAIDAEIEIVLEGRRIDDRHQCRRKHLLALVRQRRGLAAVVVTGERQHAAMPRRAGRIGMFQCVDRAINAGTLAIPDAEHAIDLGARKQADLLATPDGGRGEVLVQPGNESDIMCLQERFGAPQRVVIHAERRAAVAGDEARGVETGRAIAFALQHRQSHQRLDAGQVDPFGLKAVLVVQPDLHQRHFDTPVFSLLGPAAPGKAPRRSDASFQ